MTEYVNRIYAKNITRTDVTLHITRPITDPDDFIDEVQMFSAVDENDSVRVWIVSPGGQLDTCQMLVKAMNECKAEITGWIGPTCASAGSAIALACTNWEVDEMSVLMIHTASFGDGGKAPEVEAGVSSKLRQIRRWVETTYAGFLTQDEIENVIAGRDYYFDVDNGLVERLQAYGEYREEKRKAAELEQKEAMRDSLKAQLAAMQSELEDNVEVLDTDEEIAVESPPKPKRQRKST